MFINTYLETFVSRCASRFNFSKLQTRAGFAPADATDILRLTAEMSLDGETIVILRYFYSNNEISRLLSD